MVFRFGDYELDVDAYELRRAGEHVAIEPQVFDVLAFLVANRARVVRKEELLDAVWGDRFVSESALTTRLKSLRRALDDDGRRQETIRTVHGRGYQFVARVESDDAAVPPRVEPAPAGGVRAALPVPGHPIYGRDAELAAVDRLLDEARVVTVVGPGGTGKTRLAVEAAIRRVSTYDHAVVFAELAAVGEGAAVPDAVAATLGIQTGQRSDLLAACAELFGTRPHLLVLDNCEHVLGEASRIVEYLVPRCTGLRVLATSREPLGAAGERVFRLDPLPVPSVDGAEASALARAPILELFAERARAVDPDFVLDERNLASVVALCRSLDGLPLAVELAAGRLAALDVEDLRARLDRRLDLIGATRGTAEDRHRTLRATIDWSYELLVDDERRLLRWLSVFPAGVSLETAEWTGKRLGLSDDPALLLSRLVEASMVTRSPAPEGTRYGQLDTVRAYGIDRLEHEGERDDAALLLVAWAETFAERAERGVESEAEPMWDARIRREFPNLRAARTELLERGEIGRLVALMWRLGEWSWVRAVAEFRRWQLELVDQTHGADLRTRQAALAIAADASWLAGRLDLTEATLAELDTGDIEDPEIRSRALHARGSMSLFRGEFDAAARDWRARYESGGRLIDLGSAVISAAYGGDLDSAREMLAIAHAHVATCEIPSHRAWIHYATGEVEAVAGTGDHVGHLEAAIAEGDRAGATFVSGVARVTLVSELARSGRIEEAIDGFVELIEQWLRGGNWTQQWVTLRNVAELLVGLDDRMALALWAAADRDPFAPMLVADSAASVAAAREYMVTRLGERVVAEIEAEAVGLDRVQHAERAIEALRRLRPAGPVVGRPARSE